ncbi:MAG: oxygenase MpaB family protein, partial [Psychrobacter sp.]
MDKKIINTASTLTDKPDLQSSNAYQRHGRTTDINDHSDLQVLKRIKRYLLPKDFTISPALLDEIVAGYDIGDPLADALAAQNIKFAKPLQQTILGNRLSDNLNNSLNNDLITNPSFSALTEQFSSHPDWFDPKLAQIGAVAYRRYPLMLIWLLRNVALMAGYSIPALSLPLIQTGALMHDALPRLMRTYAYILAVSEHPSSDT